MTRKSERNDAQKPTVFVVDDDPGVLDSLRLLLRSVDLPSEGYGSAMEFLEAFHPRRRGCLVLDLRMPDMNGLELQRHLNALGARLPIIFITAHGEVASAVEAVKAGAVDFIQKPFQDEKLLEKIHQALAVSDQEA